MCCNGVIFADVKLQRGDNLERFRSLGVEFGRPHSRPPTPHLTQPCAALAGCRCQIYAERPKYCRQFECLLLQRVKTGKMKPSFALRKIAAARRRAEKVRGLLRALDELDENAPLRTRFQRVTQVMKRRNLDPEAAHTYSELTLAVQDLNLLLGEDFYPGT
jgi:Fe-S-cluster containining protein